MRLSKILFKAIDKLTYLPVNPAKEREKLADVLYVKDIHYSKQYPDLALDICYLPKPSGTYPVIMEIHGGGFSAGDKSYREVLCKYYAKHCGAVVVNVNYGLGPERVCPVPVQNLVEAVNWVYAHRRKYRLDLSRFIVTGDSAGAYYSCMLSVLQSSSFLQSLYECSPKVKFSGAVLNCGVYDMPTALNKKMLFNLTSEVFEDITGTTLNKFGSYAYRDGISPLSHVTSSFPQSLLIYARKDALCNGQGESMADKLTQVGADFEVTYSENFLDNHTYSLMWYSSKAKETNARILQFMQRHFQSSPQGNAGGSLPNGSCAKGQAKVGSKGNGSPSQDTESPLCNKVP